MGIKHLTSVLVQTLKIHFFAIFWIKFVTFFSFFALKNAKNYYFNQRLGCAAPKCWPKYTTPHCLIGFKICLFVGSYKMVVGQWYFFAIVLDGISKQGLIQIDYAYGYNNGTTDFKVFSSLKFSNIYCFSNMYCSEHGRC